MSLLSMPFVDTNIDTALSVFAGVVLIATIAAVGIGFWKIHELPIHKASTKRTSSNRANNCADLDWLCMALGMGYCGHYCVCRW